MYTLTLIFFGYMVPAAFKDLRTLSRLAWMASVDLLTLFVGSVGLRLYGPHSIHGLSDPLETGSDGPCGFPDPLGSPGLLSLAVTRSGLGIISFYWFLGFFVFCC